MNKTEQVIDHADRLCVARGSRLTAKRKMVLAVLLQSERALSAYELVEVCNKEHDQKFAAMSVYRILEFLEQENFVHKLHLSNRFVACVHISCDHAHEVPQFLVCTSCQRVKEIGISRAALSSIQQQVKLANYRLVSPQLELNCLCESCVAA